MTAFTTITTPSLGVGKPFTSTIAIAMRDNPVAIAEGDVTAPKIAFAALDAWYITAGAVGTYAFAKGNADKAFGATIAGSNLTPTSAIYSVTGGGSGSAVFDVGSALSGTWQCMGTFDLTVTAGIGNYLGATLWLRIA